jgi:ribosomal protein L37AE/L43A
MAKRHKKNNYTPGDILRISNMKPRLMKHWKDHIVPEHHACPNCGENRMLRIVHLRAGLKSCETCGKDFLVTDRLEKNYTHEDKNNE